MSSPAAPENNLHHTGIGSEADWWDQFRYDPDYPQTHAESDIDFTELRPF